MIPPNDQFNDINVSDLINEFKETLRKHDLKYFDFIKNHMDTISIDFFKRLMSKYAKWKSSYLSILQNDKKHLENIFSWLNDNNIMPIKYLDLDPINIASSIRKMSKNWIKIISPNFVQSEITHIQKLVYKPIIYNFIS